MVNCHYISAGESWPRVGNDTHILIERSDGARVVLVLVRAGTGVVHGSDGSVLARNVEAAVLDLLDSIRAEEVTELLESIVAESGIGDRGRSHDDG